MRVLGPVVLVRALFMPHRKAKLTDGGTIGPELVGDDRFQREALFSEQLSQEPDGRGCLPT